MKQILFAAVVALTFSSTSVLADRSSALATIRTEPKVKDALWPEGQDLLYVGVLNDGSLRDGYAMYICEVLREHDVHQGVRVQIMDIVRITRDNEWVKLGVAEC